MLRLETSFFPHSPLHTVCLPPRWVLPRAATWRLSVHLRWRGGASSRRLYISTKTDVCTHLSLAQTGLGLPTCQPISNKREPTNHDWLKAYQWKRRLRVNSKCPLQGTERQRLKVKPVNFAASYKSHTALHDKLNSGDFFPSINDH